MLHFSIGQARIRQYADRPRRPGVVVRRRRHDSGRVRGHQTVAGCAGGRHPGRRMEAESHRQRRPAESAGADARRGGTRTSQPEDQPLGEDPAPVRTAHGAARPDPLLRSPMAQVLRTSIARGDFLTVRQGPGEFALDYGTSQRSFTPGAHSVVSAQSGVADQTSGWKGREYVISVRAQLGPDVTERYGLSADGKHLVAKLHIATEELSAVDLTRVYDPSNETAPRQLPTND